MRAKDFITELETNPFKAFGQGFSKGSDSVKDVFRGRLPSSSKRSYEPKTSSTVQLEIHKMNLSDTKEIFSAVIENKVGELDSRQLELARRLLEKLNRL